MIEAAILVLASILVTCSCLLTFCKDLYDKWYFVPLGLLISIFTNILWFTTAKYFNDPRRTYIMSLGWDIVVCLIYFILPVIFCKIKLNKSELTGIIVMIIGLLIMKIKF